MRKLAVLSLLIATTAFADGDARKTAEAGWKAYQKKDLRVDQTGRVEAGFPGACHPL